jgi:DNA replication protein DnaC
VNPEQEVIKLYAKQLKLTTLVNIDDLIRQAEENSQGYATFLSEVLKREIHQREENRQRRQVRQARFPLAKSIDTLELNRFEKVEEAVIWQLATGDFVKHRENVIMIGNPGNGNYRKYLVMERFSTNSRQSYGQCPKSFHNIDVI